MTPADRPRFAACLGTLAEVFRAPLSTVQAEAYWRALADLTLVDLEAAAEAFARHRRDPFLPVPAEWRVEALEHAKGRRERLIAGKLLAAAHDDNPDTHVEVAQMVADVVAKCQPPRQ